MGEETRALWGRLSGERTVIVAMLVAIVLAGVSVWVAIGVTTAATRKVAAQDDLLADVGLDVVSAHVHIEEHLGGEASPEHRRGAVDLLAEARGDCATALRGGDYEGQHVSPVSGELMRPLRQICGDLGALERAARERLAAPATSRAAAYLRLATTRSPTGSWTRRKPSTSASPRRRSPIGDGGC